MDKEKSNEKIKSIITSEKKFTIVGNTTSIEHAFKNLISILKNKNNISIAIGILVNETYYLYDSYQNRWEFFGEELPSYFRFTYSYDCSDEELFRMQIEL